MKTEKFDNSHLDYVKSTLPVLERNMSEGPLDYEISVTEISRALKKLKNGKSSGPDGISNEMIKHGGHKLHEILHWLYNKILEEGHYPKAWRSSIITPIYKSLDPNNPSNYRGVAVANCLSKIFISIINERIYGYFHLKGFWAKNQNGFMKQRQTTDNVFILHTVFQKFVKMTKQKLYVAFADFKKYFDTINRDMLLYKLIRWGISGNVYFVIKSAYVDSMFSVKTDYGLTEFFKSSIGVKQGCNLSPTLSNIYQNDLHDIFDNTCDPVDLNSHSLNSLSWADDLVLVSKSKEGLQNCLNRLDTYCYKWGLTVNVSKTKYMVMSSGIVRKGGLISYRECPIEYVNQYRYLGVILSSTGTFKKMIRDRCVKAKQAGFQIRSAISTTHNVSRKLAISIFDKQIAPILTYGSELWGQRTDFCSLKLLFSGSTIPAKEYVSQQINTITGHKMRFNITRTDRSQQTMYITVADLTDKVLLLHHKRQGKDEIIFEDCLSSLWNEYEKVHLNYCKFVLGISKYASNLAVLGELGRFPVADKITVSHVLYWLRLEQGTENPILNNAFTESKLESHCFIKSIQYVLSKSGLCYIYSNPQGFSKDYVKMTLRENLKDQFRQYFFGKLRSSDSLGILQLCKGQEVYEVSSYIDKIRNLKLRNIFLRLRINQTKLKGHLRGADKVCEYCKGNEIEDVKHLVLYCKREGIVKYRSQFLEQISCHVPYFYNQSDSDKLRQILNLKFNCHIDKDDEVTQITCKFIKNIYELRF